jgi:serine/threonine protein kinase
MQLPNVPGRYTPSPPLGLPSRFGRYRLTQLLAVGGMSQVYLAKAFGAEGFVKPLVIKRLEPALADNPNITNLFINEAKLLVSLNHGNIVSVFDFGRVGDDLYMAMEYIHGASLRMLINSLEQSGEQLDVQLAAHITTEICKGLDYAHRKTDAGGRPAGIIHRDIKPTNILLSNEGEVKIVDFGVAKLADRMESGGQLTGTLAYMSPEQAEGLAVDPRTDIFSAGLVLYEMLTGQRIYIGDTATEMLNMARSAEIPILPDQVPRELQEVAIRATRRAPGERFSSAHEMEQSLSEYLLLARSAGGVMDSLSPASKLAALMKRLPLEPQAPDDDEEEEDEPIPEEPGPVQVSGLLEEQHPPDLAMIRNAAETFHSEFWTRILQEEQQGTRGVSLRLWIGGGVVGAVVLALVVVGLFWWLGEDPPAGAGRSSTTAGDTKTAPTDHEGVWGLELTVSPDAGKHSRARASTRRRVRQSRHGFLDVNSVPWSNVIIDGRRMKRPTPILGLKLKTGKHTIVLVNRERKLRKRFQVWIRPGVTTRKFVRLK